MKILLAIEIPDAALEKILKSECQTKEQFIGELKEFIGELKEFIGELKEAFFPDAGELLSGATVTLTIEELTYNKIIYPQK